MDHDTVERPDRMAQEHEKGHPKPQRPSTSFSFSAFQLFSFSAFQLFSFSAFQLFSFSAFHTYSST
jgi:hypothetical protein